MGYVMLPHEFFVLFLQDSILLSDILHDLESLLVLQTLQDQIVHDIITGGDDLAHGGHALPDVVLSISKPYGCPVREA